MQTPMIPICNGFYRFPLSRAVNSNSLIFDPPEVQIDLYSCYGNKNGRQIRVNIGIIPFWSKLETFDRAFNIEHKQIPKRCLNRL